MISPTRPHSVWTSRLNILAVLESVYISLHVFYETKTRIINNKHSHSRPLCRRSDTERPNWHACARARSLAPNTGATVRNAAHLVKAGERSFWHVTRGDIRVSGYRVVLIIQAKHPGSLLLILSLRGSTDACWQWITPRRLRYGGGAEDNGETKSKRTREKMIPNQPKEKNTSHFACTTQKKTCSQTMSQVKAGVSHVI